IAAAERAAEPPTEAAGAGVPALLTAAVALSMVPGAAAHRVHTAVVPPRDQTWMHCHSPLPGRSLPAVVRRRGLMPRAFSYPWPCRAPLSSRAPFATRGESD